MSSKHTSLGGTFGGSLEGYFGRRSLRVLALMSGIALALVLFAGPARADTFTVDSLGDAGDADTTDGSCATADGECTLRAALQQASATSDQADTITFASGVSDEITLSNGQLRVESSGGPLRIEGPGADQLAVDGNDSSRVFLVTSGAEASIESLTVRDGNVGGSVGGGIFNDGTMTLTNSTVSGNSAEGRPGGSGGGIFNSSSGTLTVDSSTISGNRARLGSGIVNSGTMTVNSSTVSNNVAEAVVVTPIGGGIYNEGTLKVNSSTISGNRANFGGGIASSGSFTTTAPKTTIRNSTISGNAASNRGGGVFNFDSLTVIENSTITKNVAPVDSGAGVASKGNSDTRTDVRATIISENSTTDVDFVDGTENTFNSLGSNIVGNGNATGAFNKPGDQIGVENPGLGPLQDNGGPTQTHSVLSGSPALDAVQPAGTTTGVVAAATQEPCGVQQDQRGVSRPQGEACDVGSFELEQPFVQITPGTEDFGNQRKDTQSAPQTFTVENTGAAPLVGRIQPVSATR